MWNVLNVFSKVTSTDLTQQALYSSTSGEIWKELDEAFMWLQKKIDH